MKIHSLARNTRAFSLIHLWKAAGTSLAAIAVALLATSCGGGDAGGTAGSGATANAVSKASSPPPSPTTAQILVTSFLNASAFFDSLSADGCADTNVVVALNSGTEKIIVNGGPPRSSAQALEVFINTFDLCRNLILLSGFGENQTFTYQISPDLSSAHVSGIVTFADGISGTGFDVQVDVAWTGAGTLSETTVAQHTSSFPGGVFNTHFTGLSRPAIASGTVISTITCNQFVCQPGTTNYTPAASAFGELDQGNAGEIDITPVASSTSASTTP